MNSLLILAHAGEDHESEIGGFWHQLTQNSVLFLIFMILLSFFIVGSVYLLSKKSLGASFVALQIVLLLVGILSFSVLPVFAVICIVLGFSLSLFLAISGIKSQG